MHGETMKYKLRIIYKDFGLLIKMI